MNISLDSIRESVNAATPFQKDAVMATYANQKITAELEYHSISTKGNTASVTARVPNGYPWVYFNIDLNSYPQFKIMNMGDHITLTAVIDSVTSEHTVNFRDIEKISFGNEMAVVNKSRLPAGRLDKEYASLRSINGNRILEIALNVIFIPAYLIWQFIKDVLKYAYQHLVKVLGIALVLASLHLAGFI